MPIDKIEIFLKRILTVFLDLVKPVSKQANPRCIIKTSKDDKSIHELFAIKKLSFTELKDSEKTTPKKIVFIIKNLFIIEYP